MIKCLHTQSNLLSNRHWRVAHRKQIEGLLPSKTGGGREPGNLETPPHHLAGLDWNGPNQIVPNWNYRESAYKTMWTLPALVIVSLWDEARGKGKKKRLIDLGHTVNVHYPSNNTALQAKSHRPVCLGSSEGANSFFPLKLRLKLLLSLWSSMFVRDTWTWNTSAGTNRGGGFQEASQQAWRKQDALSL